jgi:hypothetical protein
MKSALEIALEKSKRMAGGEPDTSLTDEQKTRIAEIRKEYEAKIAQEEIMMKSEIDKLGPAAGTPDGRAYLDTVRGKFGAEKAKLTEAMERKIERVRQEK